MLVWSLAVGFATVSASIVVCCLIAMIIINIRCRLDKSWGGSQRAFNKVKNWAVAGIAFGLVATGINIVNLIYTNVLR